MRHRGTGGSKPEIAQFTQRCTGQTNNQVRKQADIYASKQTCGQEDSSSRQIGDADAKRLGTILPSKPCTYTLYNTQERKCEDRAAR